MFRQSSIKFLADESIEKGIITHLRNCGFDVFSISEQKPGIVDPEVLETAYKQKRVLLTNDKGFSELIFKFKQNSYGVVLMRLKYDSTKLKISILTKIIKSNLEKLNKLFISITENQTRSKKLPTV